MKTVFNTKPLIAALALLGMLTSSAQAAMPMQDAAPATQATQDASGRYELQDGRMLYVDVRKVGVTVRLDFKPTELWRVASTDLIVSPDGLKRLHLLRSHDGSVDRVELESDRR